jgi:LmbE family N-acetylglucosaminyl deacetylase
MNILVVAAHPDDEVLGCGGTIAKHSRQGDKIHVLILAEGATSRDLQRSRKSRQSDLSSLAEAAQQANQVLGASLSLYDFPDNRMDSCDLLNIIKVVEKAIDEHHPEIVYTHHSGDLNIDHRRIHEAVLTATRPLPSSSVKTLLFFEIPSSTEWQAPTPALNFVPNWFVDISDTLNLKLKALEFYESEIRPWPHPRSLTAVDHLAHWRGAIVGTVAAEAFILGRNIIG